MQKEKKSQHGGKREGAGRYPRLASEGKARDNQVSVALTPELLAKLDEVRGDKSRSAYLRSLFEASLP